jgi:HemY protein
MESGEFPALGAVLAARAAHELRLYEQRDGYLARAQRLAPDEPALRVIVAADMLLDERRSQDALAALKLLPQKHTTALRLELRAQQQARNWERALPLIDQLERRNVFDAEQALQLRRHVQAENLKRKALDRREFEECWQRLPAQQKRDPKIAAAAAQCFIALGGCAKANQIIEQALEAQWDSELVGWYAECESSQTVRQIERAEKWLASEPRDAALLLVLGKLCARQQLWGKAQSYLEASISLEATHSAHLALAQLHDGLDRTEAASRHYRASLELAVRQLRQASGGRRRAAL